ncbi:MAG: hypothetical protein APR56_05165 [Methanosaeta sp. SDB]|nr:MAG: hypothetical protein APR56_05165 [Methanosaeta sp. SDB]
MPEAEVAYLTVKGPYANLEDAYSQLYGLGLPAWAHACGRRPAGLRPVERGEAKAFNSFEERRHNK